jgi:uncharacterized oligopeptide transporter (OPT) family protein
VLTTRTLGFGIVLGVVLAIANVYLGLKTGWWESGGILAALIGFMVLRRSASDEEVAASTVLGQTLASSAAAMPGAIGLLGAIPALDLLGRLVPIWLLALYGIVLGVLGLLLALVFREQLLVADALPFPGGTAIAETVQALRRQLDRGAARAALVGASIGAALTWLRDGVPSWIPKTLWLPFGIAGVPATSLTLGVGMSPLLAGFGLLIGLKNGLGLLAGAVLAWAAIAPGLVAGGIARADFGELTSFLLWPGVALMVSGGLVSFAAEWRSIARALGGWRGLGGLSATMHAALAVVGLATVLLAHIGFGVPFGAGAAVVVGSVIAALVCARAAGETGIGPMSQLGQLTQVGYGAVAAAPAPIGIGAASVVAGSIVQTAQTMESFRVGQLLGVSPARQAVAALLGIAVGTVAALPAYLLLTRAYGLGSEGLPAPAAITWKAVGEIAASGAAAMPDGAAIAALLGALAGAALELLARTSRGHLVPSPIVLGIAFVIPAESSAAIALGSLLGAALARGRADRAPAIAALGAGAIAGESIFGVLLAALVLSGLLPGG